MPPSSPARSPLTRSLGAALAGCVLLVSACSGDPGEGAGQGDAAQGDAAVAVASSSGGSGTASAAGDAQPAGVPANYSPPTSDYGLPPVVSRIRTDRKVVFITLDDGYRKDPRLVELMRSRGVPVTVFATDAAIRDDYRFLDTVRAAGATVQNHSMTHPALKGRDLATNRREICGASDVYEKQYGQRPWLLRPPYGSYSDTTRQAAKACGIAYVVMWSVSQPGRYLRFQEGNSLRPGDIILLHFEGDFVTYLNRTLTIIENSGFTVGRLEDYLPASA